MGEKTNITCREKPWRHDMYVLLHSWEYGINLDATNVPGDGDLFDPICGTSEVFPWLNLLADAVIFSRRVRSNQYYT